MGRDLDPEGHTCGLIPFETPSDLETGNLNVHMAESKPKTFVSILNHTLISKTHNQNQLQFNPNNGIHIFVSYMSNQWR